MWLVVCIFASVHLSARAQHVQTVTIYPEYHSPNGRMTFDPLRWNGHHGLDTESTAAACKVIGTRAGRWAHPDITQNSFMNAPEDPNRKGYSDPAYFMDPKIQKIVVEAFKQNVDTYGRNVSTMMYTLGIFWPKYMGWSKYGGKIPDNLDAGVELIYQMMDGIQEYTGGVLPMYYEPVNEPGGLYVYMNSSVWTEFYRLVAQRLKARWPEMRVGGPAYTGVIGVLHESNYRVWKILQGFMNMSIDHLDFFSFHAFDHYEVEPDASHKWGIFDEAKLIGIVDIVENYAHIKSAKTVPVLVTEWGLADPTVWAKQQPGVKSEWAFGFDHNSQLFIYLSNRGFVERGDSFLASHPYEERYQHAGIFYPNNTETGVARAYRFWQHFNSSHRFLRVDSKYDNTVRMVTPLVLADPFRQEVFILLNNFAQNISVVELIFPNSWMRTTYETSICYQLDDRAGGVLVNGGITLVGGRVQIPAESSCSLKFTTAYNLHGMKIVNESLYFGDRMTIPINKRLANVTIAVSNTSQIVYCRLRLTVTVNNTTSILTPASVYFNSFSLTNYFSRMKPASIQSNTDFDVFEYDVPLALVDKNVNAVSVYFHHSNGYLASAALIIGRAI